MLVINIEKIMAIKVLSASKISSIMFEKIHRNTFQRNKIFRDLSHNFIVLSNDEIIIIIN